jgi:CRISPR/Cas system-associated exonuclease Cas4 (RecB family)
MLHEYYYGEGITEEQGKRIIERMEACLKNLLEYELIKELPNVDASQIKAVDKLDSINLNGTKVYCAPDLVLLNHRVCQIIDWKTGKDSEENEEDEAWQVKVYAKYAKEKFRIDEALEIKADLVYLENGTMDERTITTKDIRDVERFIKLSIENMQSYLEDKDQNIVKGTGSFPVTSDEKACRRCNFVEACKT